MQKLNLTVDEHSFFCPSHAPCAFRKISNTKSFSAVLSARTYTNIGVIPILEYLASHKHRYWPK